MQWRRRFAISLTQLNAGDRHITISCFVGQLEPRNRRRIDAYGAGLRRLRGWLSQCIHRGRNDFLRAPTRLPWREAHATPKSLRVAHLMAPSY